MPLAKGCNFLVATCAILCLCFEPAGASVSPLLSRLSVRSIQQSNPLASCSESVLQDNVISAIVQLDGDAALAGSSSSITISNLIGATVKSPDLPVSVAGPCPDIEGKSNCFSIPHESFAWEAAEAKCIASGGHLASFEDQAEEMQVVISQRQHFEDWNTPFWIGLSKETEQEAWTWTDGSAVSFTSWGPGEPQVNASGKSCVALLRAQWFVRDCEHAFPRVCATGRITPADMFCSDSRPGFGKWEEDTLTLRLCEDASVSPGDMLQLFFNVSNPTQAQPSPDVSISLSGSVSVDPTPMIKPGIDAEAAGVWGGADPLLILNRCTHCPAGTFVNGSNGCAKCEPGSFSGQEDSPECMPCPPNANSTPGSAACTCTAGRWTTDHTRCSLCDTATALRGPSGHVSDGSGAGEYLPGSVCTWTIASGSWKVALEFDWFNVPSPDTVLVSACNDEACSKPTPLASLSGPLRPRNGSLGFPPPRPPPGPAPSQTLGVFESASGIIQVLFRAVPAPYGPPGHREGFGARWFSLPPSLTSTSLLRIDPALPCNPAVRRRNRSPGLEQSRGGGVVEAWQRGGRGVAGAGLESVLVLALALDGPAPLQAPSSLVVQGLSAAAALSSPRPLVHVQTAEPDQDCQAWGGGGRVVGRRGKCVALLAASGDGGQGVGTWAEGERACGRIGGHLASVESAEERDAVYGMLLEARATYAWIGYHRETGSGRFVWADGAGGGFEAWYPTDSAVLPPDVLRQDGGCASVWAAPVLDPRWHRTLCNASLPHLLCSRPRPPALAFCSGGQRGVGEWEAGRGGGTLRLRLCEGGGMEPGVRYLVSLNSSHPAPDASSAAVNVSVSGGTQVAGAVLKVSPLSACLSCPPPRFPRFLFACPHACPAPAWNQSQADLYCAACPANAQPAPGASRCQCIPGFKFNAASTECVPCAVGFFCSGGAPPQPCPPNTTSAPGAASAEQCTCAPGFAAGPPPRVCVPCPANFYCEQSGRPMPCPAGASSDEGAASAAACSQCAAETRLHAAEGSVSAGLQSVGSQRCRWVIAPPHVDRVVLSLSDMVLPGQGQRGDGGVSVEVRECADSPCLNSRLLRRFQPSPVPQPTPPLPQTVHLNSSSGVIALVLLHSASSGPPPPGMPYMPPSVGAVSVSVAWFAEPSLARKAMTQSNPMASCPHNSSFLQTNVIMLALSLRSSLLLSGDDRSALTIVGLRGAVVQSRSVPVEVTALSDACSALGGGRASGSDQCFLLSSAAPTTADQAAVECEEAGGVLACIGSADENSAAAAAVAAGGRAGTAWIGNQRAECASAYRNWRSPPRMAGWCAAMAGDGMWDAAPCESTGAAGLCARSLPVHRQQLTPFCTDRGPGWGGWDEAGEGLVLHLCGGAGLAGYQDYLIAFSVLNPSADQPSPAISLAVSGTFEIPMTAVDKPARGDDSEPLKIVGGDASTICKFPHNEHDDDGKHGSGRHRGVGAGLVALFVALGLLLVGLGASPWSPLWKLLPPCNLDCPTWARAPLALRLPELPRWCHRPAVWYRRFRGGEGAGQEFEDVSGSGQRL